MRVAKAQDEMTDFCGDGEKQEYESLMSGVSEDDANDMHKKIVEDRRSMLRGKYDIPQEVHLFYRGMESALGAKDKTMYQRHLAAWVRGKLREEDCMDLYWHFEEFRQCDWGWIMIERPLGYYDAPSDEDTDDVLREMVSIGTRSRSKARNLPEL